MSSKKERYGNKKKRNINCNYFIEQFEGQGITSQLTLRIKTWDTLVRNWEIKR